LKKRKTKSRASGGKKDWASRLVKNVWPTERDFFERPDRYRYVRKLLPETNACVFCESYKAGLGFESLMLAKDDETMVLMNKFPYNSGHLLILPRAHQGILWEIPSKVAARLTHWLQVSTRILKAELNCQGFNVGLNLGAVAGAGIPDHLHYHVIPRWGGDTNFFPLIAETKVVPETLQQTFDRLSPHFQKEMGA
jgi:ATP adenylyltransferase